MSDSHKKLLENPEEREKLRKISLKAWENVSYRKSRSGRNHPMYGKHLSTEWKNHISKGNKGKKKPPRSEEHRKALSVAHRGLNPPNKNTNPVYCIELDKTYASASDASKEIGNNHVIDVCMGRRKTCGGYHFTFIKTENK